MSLALVRAINFIKSFLVNFTAFYLPLLFVDYGFSGLEIGILFSVFTVMGILTSFPAGVLNDKLSIKGTAVIGFLALGFYFYGVANFNSFATVLLLTVIGGFGSTIIDTSLSSIVYKSLEKRGKELGAFHASGGFGSGIGIIIGGALLALILFKSVLIITAASFFLLIVVAIFLPKVRFAKFPVKEYTLHFKKKYMILLLIPLFLFGLHWGAESTSYSLFLKQEFNLDLFSMGLYMGIPIIILGFAAYYVGRYIDKSNSVRKTFYIGLLLSGVGHALMLLPNVYASCSFRIVHEIGDAFTAVTYTVILSEIFSKKNIAGNVSIVSTVMITGSVVGSMVFGPLGDIYGYGLPFLISGILTVIAAIILYKFKIMARVEEAVKS